jgi:hypothetical protein
VKILESHTSPDGLFRLDLADLDGDLILFLALTDAHEARDPAARADWHAHAEFLQGAGHSGDRAAMAAYVATILAGELVLACTEYDSGLRSYEVSADPADDVRVGESLPMIVKTSFRTWAGEPVSPSGPTSS